jgi:hypothetical protein
MSISNKKKLPFMCLAATVEYDAARSTPQDKIRKPQTLSAFGEEAIRSLERASKKSHNHESVSLK